MTTQTTSPEDPNDLEAKALQEIRGLLDHPLYQETHPPDTPARKSRAHLDSALGRASFINHGEDDCAHRLKIWESVFEDLCAAAIEALRESRRHYQAGDQVNRPAYDWWQLAEKVEAARAATAKVCCYWRGWNAARGNPAPDSDCKLPAGGFGAKPVE